MTASFEPNLKSLQEWLLSIIVHPFGVDAALAASNGAGSLGIGPENVEHWIAPSATCSSSERLAVYNNAYFARLIECLQVEFPALRQAVGDEAFASFAVGYLQAYPPASYTLGELGRNLAKHLSETRPPRGGETSGPDWADFLIDLATLERLYAEVFDGPGEERLPRLDGRQLQAIPVERWPDLVLRPAPSLRLMELRFPVQDYVSAIRRGKSPAVPSAVATRLAVHRADFVVRRHSLCEVRFALLTELHAGRSLGNAMEQVLSRHDQRRHGDAAGELAGRVRDWFAEWTREGFFIGIAEANGDGDDISGKGPFA